MCLSLFSTPSVLPSATLYTEGSSNTNLQREGARRKRGTPPPGESSQFLAWADGRLSNDKFFGRKPNPAPIIVPKIIEDPARAKLKRLQTRIEKLCKEHNVEDLKGLSKLPDPYIQALLMEFKRLKSNRG